MSIKKIKPLYPDGLIPDTWTLAQAMSVKVGDGVMPYYPHSWPGIVKVIKIEDSEVNSGSIRIYAAVYAWVDLLPYEPVMIVTYKQPEP